MFVQISAKEGKKKFEQKSVTAMVKDYIKIYKGTIEGNPVVTPIDTYTLSYEEQSKALQLVNLIKEKRNNKNKGKKCTYDSKQKIT